MRSIRVPSLLLASALIAAAATGCATDDTVDDVDQITETDDALEVSAAAAGPTVSLSYTVSCNGPFPHIDGHATTSAGTIKVYFNISGGSHLISSNGFFSFNPGGSGTVVAKGCVGTSCTTRSRAFNYHGAGCSGGGGGGPGDPGDPR